jgi:hypothetical protein
MQLATVVAGVDNGRGRQIAYGTMGCMDALTKHLRRIAKLGGNATLKKYGRSHYKKLNKSCTKKA